MQLDPSIFNFLNNLKKYNFIEPELPEKYKLEIENYKIQLESE